MTWISTCLCSTSTRQRPPSSSECCMLIQPRGPPSVNCKLTSSSHPATSPYACPLLASLFLRGSPSPPPQLWSTTRDAHWLLLTTKVTVPVQEDYNLLLVYNLNCIQIILVLMADMVFSLQQGQRRWTWKTSLCKGEKCFCTFWDGRRISKKSFIFVVLTFTY